MITVFQKQNPGIVSRRLAVGEPVPRDVLWVDMQSPSDEEINAVEEHLGIELPTRKEIWKNHVLNRLYVEDGVAYMTAALITKVNSPYPQTSAVTFILAPGYLLTLRDIAPTSFDNFARRIQSSPLDFSSASAVLEGLLEEIITRVAHNSEIVVENLDQLSHTIFGDGVLGSRPQNPSQTMKEVLKRLGACADLNSKINESLHSLTRLFGFFKQMQQAGSEMESAIASLNTDALALIKQTAFLSDKITFQLDATLGMINVEQNLIIKIFSVAAVFFLPPTLISSIYGMNFEYMPELKWMMGYPIAILLMVFCALVPYLYFRKRGWL